MICQKLLSFLPSNNLEDPPEVEGDRNCDPDPSLNNIVPVEGKQAYDVRDVIANIVDFGDFLEVQAGFAPNIVIGFARITGRTIGVIANQPCVKAGVLDINASSKAARFIRFCNAFNIPLVTLRRRSGLPAGRAAGVRRHHPSRREDAVRVFGRDRAEGHRGSAQGVRRRLYRHVRARTSVRTGPFAWPTAEIAVMGAEGAVEIVFRSEIAEGRGQGGQAQGTDRQVPRGFLEPVRRCRPPAGGRRHRTRANAPLHRAIARVSARPSANCVRPRSTA